LPRLSVTIIVPNIISLVTVSPGARSKLLSVLPDGLTISRRTAVLVFATKTPRHNRVQPDASAKTMIRLETAEVSFICMEILALIRIAEAASFAGSSDEAAPLHPRPPPVRTGTSRIGVGPRIVTSARRVCLIRHSKSSNSAIEPSAGTSLHPDNVTILGPTPTIFSYSDCLAGAISASGRTPHSSNWKGRSC